MIVKTDCVSTEAVKKRISKHYSGKEKLIKILQSRKVKPSMMLSLEIMEALKYLIPWLAKMVNLVPAFVAQRK